MLVAAAAAAGFVVADRRTDSETTTVTATTRVTTAAASDLPAAVAAKRDAILHAAEDRDYAALARLVDPAEFSYTFGGAVAGGPIEYWKQLAREGDDPIEILGQILRMPYTLASGIFVWPFAYDKPANSLTDYERELLAPLRTTYAGESYLGWRAGIRPDGRWVFYVAGD